MDQIYRYVYYSVANSLEAEDLTETVFLKAWESLPGMRTKVKRLNFRAWLYRIAHNLVVDRYRMHKPTVSLDQTNTLRDPSPTPETILQAKEEGQRLASAIKKLEPHLQQVLVCRFINGLSHAETAQIIGISEGYVRVLQHRALKKMGAVLSEELS
ncbi:MAG: sigma-70 family RNA polymerase sigma factor [Anaerolineales bacterium]|nr:sigma-70 family RNA polymerase sigma factor [Anaerolineales bacterium]